MDVSVRVPPVVLLGAAGALQRLAARRARPSRIATVGAGVIAGGSLWMLADSIRRFVTGGTTVDPVDVDRPSSLIRTGPNRLTRNPMYVGMTGLLVAHAVVRRSLWALPPAAAFAVTIDRMQIPVEEAALRRRFGGEYEQYAAQTPRWLWAGSRTSARSSAAPDDRLGDTPSTG
ncbi:MAG: isoprenylcysteine carboxylmethyltransferase family protein [Nesterenkonia sp.]|nr:isoprenylcysteine carboxylmethyltransferase family protein [Nesterenkonia sp.]